MTRLLRLSRSTPRHTRSRFGRPILRDNSTLVERMPRAVRRHPRRRSRAGSLSRSKTASQAGSSCPRCTCRHPSTSTTQSPQLHPCRSIPRCRAPRFGRRTLLDTSDQRRCTPEVPRRGRSSTNPHRNWRLEMTHCRQHSTRQARTCTAPRTSWSCSLRRPPPCRRCPQHTALRLRWRSRKGTTNPRSRRGAVARYRRGSRRPRCRSFRMIVNFQAGSSCQRCRCIHPSRSRSPSPLFRQCHSIPRCRAPQFEKMTLLGTNDPTRCTPVARRYLRRTQNQVHRHLQCRCTSSIAECSWCTCTRPRARATRVVYGARRRAVGARSTQRCARAGGSGRAP